MKSGRQRESKDLVLALATATSLVKISPPPPFPLENQTKKTKRSISSDQSVEKTPRIITGKLKAMLDAPIFQREVVFSQLLCTNP